MCIRDSNYIADNLQISINDKQLKKNKLKLTSRRLEDIVLWLDFKIKFNKKIKKVEIANTILTQLYADQKNLLIFTYKENQTAIEFNILKTKETITY